MPTFMVIARHSPENCDWFNEKSRKTTLEFTGKLDKLLKKHGLKMLGAWTTEPAGHQAFVVFEAPSLEAFQKFNMEPEVLATNAYRTFETHTVMSMEEEAKLRKAKKPSA
jgi:hypothetical protein